MERDDRRDEARPVEPEPFSRWAPLGLLLLVIIVLVWGQLDWSTQDRTLLAVLDEERTTVGRVEIAGSSCKTFLVEDGKAEAHFQIHCKSWSWLPPGVSTSTQAWGASEAEFLYHSFDELIRRVTVSGSDARSVRSLGREWTLEQAQALHAPLAEFLRLNGSEATF